MFGNFVNVLNRGTSFVGEDTMSDVLLLGSSFYGVTLINRFELLVGDLGFIDKEEWSSVPCGEMKLCSGAVAYI